MKEVELSELMFTSLGRFRRHAAVLTVLSLVASVLVVAAPAAAADPKADYGATFDACMSAPSAGFSDVAEAHKNAGDIDCIADYGITKGTSATNYSPLMSVTREQMALFLTRLARLVGITVSANPGESGFTDVGDLTQESQTAIAQLKELNITQGTSSTTYAPSDNVSRRHMALFIARLMDKMTPMADGKIGLSRTTQFGYTPSDVARNKADKDIGSPFTDLGNVTKDEWDAITRLYELGVAQGMSDTGYSPDSDMTRAAMAQFMAAVLDHSNARPKGLSIQATPTMGWGVQEPRIVISVRDDKFMPLEDEPVDMFSSADPNGGIRKDGTCNKGTGANADDVLTGDLVDGDCEWNNNDPATDATGNIFEDGEVLEGNTRIYYVWQGSNAGDKFDADKFDEKSASVTANYAHTDVVATSDILTNAHEVVIGTGANAQKQGKQVNLGDGNDVTVTAQLKDTNDNDVKRSGVRIRIEYRQGASFGGPRDDRTYVDSHQDIKETDENGQVQFVVAPPPDSRFSSTESRRDAVVFTEVGSNGKDVAPKKSDEYRIHWIEEVPRLTSDTIEITKPYVQAGQKMVSVRVHLWDQYGNPFRSHAKQKVAITYTGVQDDGTTPKSDDTFDQVIRQVISRGYARWDGRVTVTASDNTQSTISMAADEAIEIAYDVRELARNSDGDPVQNGTTVTGAETVNGYRNEAADNPGWVNIGPSSTQSRQQAIDTYDVTYNDGSVITATAATTPVYYSSFDDDNDNTTEVTNDDDDTANTDPHDPYSRTIAGRQTLRVILNSHALDIYVDRGYNNVLASPDTRSPNAENDPNGVANVDGTAMVYVVEKADSEDVGIDALNVVYDKRLLDFNELMTDSSATEETDSNPELVWSYKDNDIFIDSTLTGGQEGKQIDIARFETLIKRANAQVEVIAYNVDGVSIFRVRT